MNPLERYQNDVNAGSISLDEEQQRIVLCFDELHAQLSAQFGSSQSMTSRLFRWIRVSSGSSELPKGIYLWGGVGRGKTYLMDLFCDCLPRQRMIRTHFHRFMQRIHTELTHFQGSRNPLEKVADVIAGEAQVLCFDEFFIVDIGDAMLMGGLLDALFERNVVLVTTSNIHPDRLYENGLQRKRFLPAIELLKTNTRVLELKAGVDYRLRSLTQATLFHTPIDADLDRRLLQSFFALAPDRSEVTEKEQIQILGRQLQTRYCGDDVVWFDYSVLCNSPRSAFDYVEIARLYHALILSGVPVLDDTLNDQARRFVNLIDELYDRRVKLIIAADAPIDQLYQGRLLAFEFERTRSRLLEMQSLQYLGYEHRA